jgi:hypothetical protein
LARPFPADEIQLRIAPVISKTGSACMADLDSLFITWQGVDSFNFAP